MIPPSPPSFPFYSRRWVWWVRWVWARAPWRRRWLPIWTIGECSTMVSYTSNPCTVIQHRNTLLYLTPLTPTDTHTPSLYARYILSTHYHHMLIHHWDFKEISITSAWGMFCCYYKWRLWCLIDWWLTDWRWQWRKQLYFSNLLNKMRTLPVVPSHRHSQKSYYHISSLTLLLFSSLLHHP